MAFPSLYNLFAIWSGPEERATLMSIVFSGISFANMINLPFSAGLCATGIDGGWPMVFYVPGGLGLLWCLIFKFLCFSTPQNHPWISDLEKMYLVTCCKVIIFTIQKYRNAAYLYYVSRFSSKSLDCILIVSQLYRSLGSKI